MVDPINATGWSELVDGSFVSAVMTMFNTAFGGVGWVVLILFFAYQVIAFLKTDNALLVWTSSTLFVAATWGAGIIAWDTLANQVAMTIIFSILVFELAAILYSVTWKK